VKKSEEYSIMARTFQYLLFVVLFVFSLSASAAASGLYVSFLGGGSFAPEAKASDVEGSTNFSFDSGFDGSIALGYDLGTDHPKIGKGRVELEFNTASNDLDEADFVDSTSAGSGSVKRTAVMLNTIGEYTTENGIMIYALLGLGWAQISLDNIAIFDTPFVDDSDSQLAYQAGLGIGWKFSPHFYFDMSYRYLGTTNPEFTKQDGNNLEYEYASHRILAGVRLHF
jgi:opacity protein-like surface antigen